MAWLVATALPAVLSLGACTSSHTSPSGVGGSTPTGRATGGAGGAGIDGTGGGGGNIGGPGGAGIAGAGGGATNVGGAAGAAAISGGGAAGQAGAAGGGAGASGGGAGGGGFGGNLGVAGAPGPDCSPLFTSGGTVNGSQLTGPAIVLANLTGHGKRDLIVANTGELMTFVNDGGGHFALSGTYYPEARLSFDVTAGDLNGDGVDDVAFVADRRGQLPMGPPLVSVFLNDGTGALTASTYALPDVGHSVVLGDLDGDHLPDVLVDGSAMAFVLPNIGAGKLGTPVVLAVALGPTAIADLDGDGRQDLLVNLQSGLEVALNTGGLTFSAKPPTMLGVPLGFNVEQFIPVDVNGDEAIDVVALGRVPMIDAGSRTVAVATNDGTGTFLETFTAKVGQNTGGLGVGDFDHDGHPDIAVAAAQEANAAIDGFNYFLATSGSYSAGACRTSAATGAGPSQKSLAVGDVNGDGRADLLIARDSGVGLLLGVAP